MRKFSPIQVERLLSPANFDTEFQGLTLGQIETLTGISSVTISLRAKALGKQIKRFKDKQ